MITVDALLERGSFTLDVAFSNDAGITALFGRSGSGKTTTIHVIAGLLRPRRGRIVLDDHVLVDTTAGIYVPKHRRRVGLVFQDAQLFPHMTVAQNLLFGRWFAPPQERVVAFEQTIETLGLAHLLDRRPAQLSGGEKQRTAIGRALLASPRILLLDEPLASLDQARKREILPLIERLSAEFRIPIIYVSHAIEEVTRLANRVVVLEAGRVAAIGTPEEVLSSRSRSADDDRFAVASVIAGRLGPYDEAYALTPLRHPAGTVFLSGKIGSEGQEARIVIRATDVALATQRPRSLSIRNVLEGAVTAIALDDGPVATVEIGLNGHGRLLATVTRRAIEELGLGEGDRVYALIKTVALDERPVALR